jgi:DNA-binding NtrC family response regulator
MADTTGLAVAAVVNSSPDIVDMLRTALEPAGIVVVSALTFDIRDGRIDFERFLQQHDPTVIVYDIAPPYQANWQLFQHLCRMREMQSRQFVLTSTNPRHVEGLAGSHQRVYEIVGKPFDLDQIVRAVKEAAKARATR